MLLWGVTEWFDALYQGLTCPCSQSYIVRMGAQSPEFETSTTYNTTTVLHYNILHCNTTTTLYLEYSLLLYDSTTTIICDLPCKPKVFPTTVWLTCGIREWFGLLYDLGWNVPYYCMTILYCIVVVYVSYGVSRNGCGGYCLVVQ